MPQLLRRSAGRASGRAVDVAYAVGWALVRAMPEPVAQRLFRAGADLAHRRGGKAVERLRSNLARVAPDADSTSCSARRCARTRATGARSSGCR